MFFVVVAVFFYLRELFCHYMTYIPSTVILVLGHLLFSTNYLQGHPIELFLKISFFFRELWKKCPVLGRNLLLGNSQFSMS